MKDNIFVCHDFISSFTGRRAFFVLVQGNESLINRDLFQTIQNQEGRSTQVKKTEFYLIELSSFLSNISVMLLR